MLSMLGFDTEFVEKKIWGWKYNAYRDHYLCVDLCYVNKDGHCSWHYHNHQYNAFLVLFGKLQVIREYSPESDKKIISTIGVGCASRKTRIHPLHNHKFEALENTIFLEIGSVRYDQDDIIRDHQDLGGA
tara:strand:+ start:274 stop:663 length:390 start_codon:yes stop_codon:yes gene_type:complete